MKNKALFYLMVACAIVLFDVVASCASKLLMFDYTKLAPVSILLFCTAGYFGCKYHGFLGGVLAGLTAGVAGSTFGWALSSLIGPYIPFSQPPQTFLTALILIVMVSVLGGICGLFGAALRRLVEKMRQVVHT